MEPINNPDLQEDNGYPPPGIFMFDYMNERREGGGEEERVRLLGDPWTIRKRLTRSDVGRRCSLILPTAMVRWHILPLWDHELVTELLNGGRWVSVYDHDKLSTHKLFFRRCLTTGSFLFGRGWTNPIGMGPAKSQILVHGTPPAVISRSIGVDIGLNSSKGW